MQPAADSLAASRFRQGVQTSISITPLLADQLGDPATRDDLPKQVIAGGAGYKRQSTGRPRVELVQLAARFIDDLQAGGKGQLHLAAIDKLLVAMDEGERLNAHYFTALYLWNRRNLWINKRNRQRSMYEEFIHR